jgi:hypothetical protein
VTNPASGSTVNGNVTVTVNSSDNSGAAGITNTLSIDNVVVATGTGSTLSYVWNTSNIAAGKHVVSAVARDAAGNSATWGVAVTH